MLSSRAKAPWRSIRHNTIAKQVDPLHYTQTFKYNTNERRPIKIGDRIEIEWSVFLDKGAIHRPHPSEDRTAYYGTPLLYVVGTPGMQPWEGIGPAHGFVPAARVGRCPGGARRCTRVIRTSRSGCSIRWRPTWRRSTRSRSCWAGAWSTPISATAPIPSLKIRSLRK